MNINKIALSLLLVTCATPIFATELRSIQLDEYNCEESSDIEVKACLETTLSKSVANLSETEYHFKKAIDDVQLTIESINALNAAFKQEKEAYALYSQQQCNFKVAIESNQNANTNIERLSLICQINAIDHRIESLTELTHDLVNDFVADKSPAAVSSDTPMAPYDEEQTSTTEYINPSDAGIQEVTEPTEVIEPVNEEFTHDVQSTDEVVPDVVPETDIEDDV
jgi:hypothetical protein